MSRKEATSEDVSDPPSHTGDRPPELRVGMHVYDREADDNSVLLIVSALEERASAVGVGDGRSVADINEDYPRQDQVFECIYPNPTLADVEAAKRYAFPRRRLVPVEVETNGSLAPDADDLQ